MDGSRYAHRDRSLPDQKTKLAGFVWSLIVGGYWVSPSDSAVKNPSARQATWIQSISQEDPCRRKFSTHSSILV